MIRDKGQYRYLLYTALACLVLCAVLLTRSTWAHFTSETERTVAVSAHELQPLYLQPVDGAGADMDSSAWATLQSGKNTMSFSLRNYQGTVCAQTDTTACVEVLASLGADQPENLTVELTVDGTVYVGTPTDIPAGTSLAYSFGEGWCYRFYDAENRELSWDFTAGRPAAYLLTVTARANSSLPFPTMLQVQVTAQA